MKKKDLILELLLTAIHKEIEAYNYYLKTSESTPYPETKSLLLQLAEEEKKHQRLLLREYRTLREMFKKSKPRVSYLTKDRVSYQIPTTLPFKLLPSISGIDLSGISLPTEFMGGDYLDAFPFISKYEKESSLGLLLCDIMGHGLKAAQLKGVIKSTFSELIDSILQEEKEEKIIATALLIHRLNQLLWEPCRKADSFITLFYCVIYPYRGKLLYTSAGHNPQLLFTDNGKKYISLANTQLIIGILEKVDYSQTEVRLEKGDLLLLYSDGLIEATNKRGKEFGIKKLIELVQENYNLPSKEIIQQICQRLTNFLNSKLMKDDFSLAIAKIV